MSLECRKAWSLPPARLIYVELAAAVCQGSMQCERPGVRRRRQIRDRGAGSSCTKAVPMSGCCRQAPICFRVSKAASLTATRPATRKDQYQDKAMQGASGFPSETRNMSSSSHGGRAVNTNLRLHLLVEAAAGPLGTCRDHACLIHAGGRQAGRAAPVHRPLTSKQPGPSLRNRASVARQHV